MICNLERYYYGRQIKEDVINGATCGKEQKCKQYFGGKT
jgi:hypothetical protein